MNIDYTAIWKLISDQVKTISFETNIKRIINLCETSFPSKLWKDVYTFHWNETVGQLSEDFEKEIDTIINRKLNGLYFGITTIELEKSGECFVLELGGTNNYDPNDPEYKWVYSLEWYSNQYLTCDALYEIKQNAIIENGLGNDLEWPLGLAVAVLGISELIKRYEDRFIQKIGVVSGFHDGDMMKIKGFNE